MEDNTRVSIEYKQLIETYQRIIRWWSSYPAEVQAYILRSGQLEKCLRHDGWGITAITKENERTRELSDQEIANIIHETE